MQIAEEAHWDVLHATNLVGHQHPGAVKALPLDVGQLLHRHLPTCLCLAHNLHTNIHDTSGQAEHEADVQNSKQALQLHVAASDSLSHPVLQSVL